MNEWLQRHRITEIECLFPDLTGIARGKIMPADKFLRKEGLRLPENLFLKAVTSDWVDEKKIEALNPAARPKHNLSHTLGPRTHSPGNS